MPTLWIAMRRCARSGCRTARRSWTNCAGIPAGPASETAPELDDALTDPGASAPSQAEPAAPELRDPLEDPAAAQPPAPNAEPEPARP